MQQRLRQQHQKQIMMTSSIHGFIRCLLFMSLAASLHLQQAATAEAATSASGYNCSMWSAKKNGHSPQPTCSTSGVYSGWIAATNMGDDLVCDMFYEVLRIAIQRKAPHATVTLEYDRRLTGHHISIPEIKPEDLQGAEFLVMGGGSMLEIRDTPYTRVCAAAGDLKLPVYFHGTGSQYPDSDDRWDKAAVKAAISVPLQFGGVRGATGLKRLQKYNSKFALPVIYDSALLTSRLFHLQPSAVSNKLKRNQHPIACFAGTEHKVNQWFFGDKVEVFAEAVAGFINITRIYKVVLIPVDKTSMQRALQVQTAVLESGLPAERFLVNHAFTDWPIMMDIMSHCSIVFSDRLHGGILSAAVGTPFNFFSYEWSHFKMQDFSDSMGVSNFQERVSETFNQNLRAQRLVDTMLKVNSNRTALVRSLNQHVNNAYELHVSAMDKFVTYLLACRPELQKSLDTALVVRISGLRSTKFEGSIVTIDTCETPASQSSKVVT